MLFFQFLEDCWHQEHFKRPSAATLCKAVQKLSGSFDMSSKAEQPKGHRELQGILLDSYTLHQGHRISACQTVVSQDSYTSFYTMCVALSSPDDYSTTIAISKYSAEDPRTELQAEVLIHCFSRILRFLIITPCACIRGEVISCVGHTKLISCSTEHQGNEVVSVGRKKKL